MIEAALGRLGAMKTDLLPESFFGRLMGAEVVERAIEMLIGTTYEPAVRRSEGQPTTVLERELWQEVFEAWTKLVKFLDGPEAELAIAYVRTFEVENIRRTVRRVLANMSPTLVPQLWDVGPLSSIKVGDLARAHTMMGVHQIVERSPYARVFDLAEHRLVEGEPLFAFEQVLDAGHLDMLLVAGRAVKGAHGRSAREYVESRLHFTNVRWALRLRFGRRVPKEDARQYLARESAPEHRKDINGIVDADEFASATRFLTRLLGKRGASHRNVRECDRALRSELARWSRRQLRKAFFQFASVFAYLDVRVQEVRDIAAVLVGIRQGRSEAEMRSRLGLVA